MKGYALSPQQRRLWQLGGKAPFASCRVERFDRGFDEARLRDALAAVVAGHDGLRARIVKAGAQWVQGVEPGARVAWQADALAPPRPHERANERRNERPNECPNERPNERPNDGSRAHALFEHARAHGAADPERGPVLGAMIAPSGDGDGGLLLALTAPALFADRAALRLVMAQLRAGAPSGGGSALAFAAWQNELLARDPGTSPGLAYWAARRRATQPSPPLPLERRGSPAFRPVSAHVVRLDPAATAALTRAAGDAGLEALVLAAWCALIARLTEATELEVAIHGDGRETSELASVVGLLARWLPIHAPVARDRALPELAALLAGEQRAAREWQRYFVWPCEREPLVDGRDYPGVAFRWDLAADGAAPGHDPDHDHDQIDRWKVCLRASVRDHALGLDLAYDAEALPDAAAQQLGGQLAHVLRQLGERPDTPIGALLLVEPGRESWWSGPRSAPAGDAPGDLPSDLPSDPALVHRAFEAHVAARADQLAVVSEDDAITHAALEARANQLAHALRRAGVGPEVRVGLLLERSVDMIVGMLGVLKAGGAYVPLDPGQPRQRLALLLEDIAAPVAVTSHRHLELLRAFAAAPIAPIVLDRDPLAREPTTPVDHDDDPRRAAYVLFTSGSTGRPKGVVIEHRQLASYTASVITACDLPPGGSYATVSTFAADLGNTMIFPALATGGTLHVIAAARATDPAALADYFARWPIDCLKIVPSHLEALLSGAPAPALLPRRRLILGGEASALTWVRQLADAVPGCAIYNHYGPTETTVGVLTFGFDPARALAATTALPLERVVRDTRVYLLDAGLRAVPAGVAGDVYVSGAAVSRGYLRRPGLTAQAYVPDPRGPAGARMYRTGDRARRLADGTFEFLGRGDHQVKFHGHRLELAEVRLAINEHPQIRNSVARLVKDGAGNAMLAAYYVSRQPVDADELRGFLKERLAEEVVPNVYVHLKALPLTLNGKLNVDALPSIEEARQRGRRAMVAPSTPAEATLAQIWCDVLHLAEISVEDNFFSVGGDSILAIVVVSRANTAGLRLSPRQLFQHQSIAALARVATAAEPAEHDAGAADGPLPWLPMQRWFLDHVAGAALDAASFVVWLEARRPIDPALIDRALAALWRHHGALRLQITDGGDGGAPSARIAAAGEPPALLARVSAPAGSADELAAVHARAEADLRRQIRLADGRPVAAAWIEPVGDRPGRLAIAAHRFAVDAVSWRILAEQLELACAQLSGGHVALPPSTTSLRAWAAWLAAHAASAACQDELDHWAGDRWRDVAPLPRDRDAAPGVLDLALDRALDAAASRALLDDAPARWRCTLDELLVAALGDVLCAWAGGRAVAVDLERHGREDIAGIDLSRTVGWLTAVAPVRLAPHAGAAGLRAVKDELRAARLAGLGHGLLRHASPDPEVRQRMAAVAPATLLVRYTGRHGGDDGAWFRVLDTEAQAMTPHYAIVVLARVVDRRIEIRWLASSAVYDRGTLESLADRLAAALARLGALEPSDEQALVPSDFPLSGLDQASLARLLARLK